MLTLDCILKRDLAYHSINRQKYADNLDQKYNSELEVARRPFEKRFKTIER